MVGWLALLAAVVAAPVWAAEDAPVKRTLVWDTAALGQTPKVHPTEECSVSGLRVFFYEGMEYKGRPTWVYAYYAPPAGDPPEGGWPAVVCAHGGGGTAYPEWIKMWNDHGYAAISMDLEGHLPDQRGHENAGPVRQNWFSDIGLPDHEQWFYHAVADVVRANSLLHTFHEINPAKIGLIGISWGGTIVCTAAGLDPRWAFVVPVYGCGFIHESDNEGVRQWFREGKMTADQVRDYRTKWDPSAHLPFAKMPMLWVNGSNDGTFPMDIFQRSALAAPGPHTLCVRFRMLHGHAPGWKPREIYDFADSIVKGGKPMLTAARPVLDHGGSLVRCKTTGKIIRAALCYTTSGGEWKNRYWDTAPCEIGATEVSGQLPQAAKEVYFNIKDDRGNLVSSEYIEVKNP